MISSVYAACSDGTAATGFAYSDPRSYSPSNEKARNGHVAGDRADQPRRRVELAHPAREPRRCGREEREGDERHPGEERDAGDVAAEARAVEEPEQPGDEIRRDEVAHVDGPGREVVPAQRPPSRARAVPAARPSGRCRRRERRRPRAAAGTRSRRAGRRRGRAAGRRPRARARAAATRARRRASSPSDWPSRARAGRARSRRAAARGPRECPRATCTRSARAT